MNMHKVKHTSALSTLSTLVAPKGSVTSLPWDNSFVGGCKLYGGEYHAMDVKWRRQAVWTKSCLPGVGV